MEISMLEKMQLMPLLQGMRMEEFNQILMNMKLDFRQWNEGETIVSQGDRCKDLIYIISGEFEAEIRNDESHNLTMIVSETSDKVPHLIEPHSLFGIKRIYERTYTFKTSGATFTISRDFFLNRMLNHQLIRSNYINIICNELRKSNNGKRFAPMRSVEEKMIAAISSYCLFAEGTKNVRITMNDFATMIDETRLNVSGVLNRWKAEDLIELRRYGFSIKEFSKLKA